MAKWSALEVPTREVPVPDAEAVPDTPTRGYGPDSSRQGYGPEDFPGCESFHLPEAALACTGEADFRRRIRERFDPPPELSP